MKRKHLNRIDDWLRELPPLGGKNETIMAVDPGVNVGWAVWKRQKLRLGIAPTATGVIDSPPQKRGRKTDDITAYCDKLRSVARAFDEALSNYPDTTVVFCEWPQYWSDSKMGQAAASEGNLVKLAFSVGWIAAVCDKYGAEFRPVEVNRWKGQLRKREVIRRIKILLGKRTCKGIRTHAWDAVGVGLWALDKFDYMPR